MTQITIITINLPHSVPWLRDGPPSRVWGQCLPTDAKALQQGGQTSSEHVKCRTHSVSCKAYFGQVCQAAFIPRIYGTGSHQENYHTENSIPEKPYFQAAQKPLGAGQGGAECQVRHGLEEGRGRLELSKAHFSGRTRRETPSEPHSEGGQKNRVVLSRHSSECPGFFHLWIQAN